MPTDFDISDYYNNNKLGFGKWIVIHGIKLMKTISPEDLERTEKETEELEKVLKDLELQQKQIDEILKRVGMSVDDPEMENLTRELKDAKSDEERKEIDFLLKKTQI